MVIRKLVNAFNLIVGRPSGLMLFLFLLLLSGNTVFTSYAFLATGGSTTRTMPDRLADVRNIKDFGAVADSTNCLNGTDNTTAIQNAVNASGSGEVFIPAGRYNVGKTSGIGINLDSLGSGSYTIRGVGAASILCGNIPDFILRRVVRNPASPIQTRVIDNLQVVNLNTSPGSNINLSSATWAANTITFGMSSPHGIAVGDTRLINVTGVTGVTTYNGVWGVTATTTTVVTTPYSDGSLGAGTGGVFSIMPGGAIAMNGSLRGSIQNVVTQGFYSIYAQYDATISVYNASVSCPGSRTAGTVGVYMGGEMGINGFDITNCDNGIATNLGGAVAGIIANGRVEINNNGLLMRGSGWSVIGTSFESNQNDAILIGGGAGSGTLNFSGIHVIGSVASVNGLHISGGCLYCTFQNMDISGTFSGAAVTVDAFVNTQGTRFSGIIASCAACTQISMAATGIQIESSNFTKAYTVAQLPLAAGGSPPQDGDLLLVTDNDDAAWTGSASNVGKPVAHTTGSTQVWARYSPRTDSWTIAGAR